MRKGAFGSFMHDSGWKTHHPAAMLSWAFMKAIKKGSGGSGNEAALDRVDNDYQRHQVGPKRWVSDLLELNAGRIQLGGCFWMHDDVRRALIREVGRGISQFTG